MIPLKAYLIGIPMLALAAVAGVQTLRVAHLQRDAAQVQAQYATTYASALRQGWTDEKARNRTSEAIADQTREQAEQQQLDTQRATTTATDRVREIVRRIPVPTETPIVIPAELVAEANSVVDRANTARGLKPESHPDAPPAADRTATADRMRLVTTEGDPRREARRTQSGLRAGHDSGRTSLSAEAWSAVHARAVGRAADDVGHGGHWTAGRGTWTASAGARVHREVEERGRDSLSRRASRTAAANLNANLNNLNAGVPPEHPATAGDEGREVRAHTAPEVA